MYTLLLVTQFPDEQAIYGEALRAHGFSVHATGDAEVAFAYAKRRQPDLIITRIPHPGPVGLLQLLKRDAMTRSLPVVVLTSLMQPQDRTAAMLAGCDGYLLLPTLPETLIKEIRRVIARRRHQRAV
jgi:DNA-binding response OmpR family regulator